MFCKTNKSSSWQQEGQGFTCPGEGTEIHHLCGHSSRAIRGRGRPVWRAWWPFPEEARLHAERSEGLWARQGQNLIWAGDWRGFLKAEPGSGHAGPVCDSSDGPKGARRKWTPEPRRRGLLREGWVLEVGRSMPFRESTTVGVNLTENENAEARLVWLSC